MGHTLTFLHLHPNSTPFARLLVRLQPYPYSSSLRPLSPPPSERMSFLQSFAISLLSYARRKPFRAMAWLSVIHWVLNFARRFYNRLVNDRFIRKIPSPKALLHPILGMVPSLAVSLTGTGIMNLGHNITSCSCLAASTRGSARFRHTPPRPRSFSLARPSQGYLLALGPRATSQCVAAASHSWSTLSLRVVVPNTICPPHTRRRR